MGTQLKLNSWIRAFFYSIMTENQTYNESFNEDEAKQAYFIAKLHIVKYLEYEMLDLFALDWRLHLFLQLLLCQSKENVR